MSSLLIAACLSLAVVTAVPDAPAATADTYQGKIAGISKVSVSLMDRQGENKTFAITADTKITINGKPAGWQDIGVGNMAKIKATGDMTALVAMTVEVRSVEKVIPVAE